MSNCMSILKRVVVALPVLGLLAGAHEALSQDRAGNKVAQEERADVAAPRTDQNSQTAHEDLLKKKSGGQIDVYFLGDSITRRWDAAEPKYRELMENWNANFHGWNAADFGWGGDKTQNILWRLEHGELDGVNPKVIVLMAGTNNVGKEATDHDAARAKEIAGGIKKILDVCRQKAPHATIILMGITPRNDNMAVMPLINAINGKIAKFADGKRIRYININDRLADAQGHLHEGMTDPDLLHLRVPAYQIWADALKPVLTELLGPRAAEDHAPAATADPSAVQSNATH